MIHRPVQSTPLVNGMPYNENTDNLSAQSGHCNTGPSWLISQLTKVNVASTPTVARGARLERTAPIAAKLRPNGIRISDATARRPVSKVMFADAAPSSSASELI